MKKYLLGIDAELDLLEIWEYIAEDSVDAADRWVGKLFEAFDALAGTPAMGHKREDLTSHPIRFWPVGAYLVLYRAKKSAHRDYGCDAGSKGYSHFFAPANSIVRLKVRPAPAPSPPHAVYTLFWWKMVVGAVRGFFPFAPRTLLPDFSQAISVVRYTTGEAKTLKRPFGFIGNFLIMALALTAVAQGEVKMSIWGHTKDGVAVPIYTLKSAQIEVRVMAYGAKLVSIRTPDSSGKMADVVLGYDSLDEYLNDNSTHFGSVVGRYGNRIAGGKFSIDGKSYQIPINNGKNALHGGPMGFDRYVWDAKEVPNGVEFTLVSPDGDMGFPGKMTAKVKYTLAGNTLRLDYSATSDKPTVVNLTNHAYFNLRGDDVGTILDEKLELNADKFTPVNADLIPLGALAPVAGTPLDFRKPEVVGARINSDHEQIKLGGGYDHNFVVNGNAGTMRVAAVMTDPESGRRMTVETTEPGVQFYTGNFLDGTFTGRHGVKYEKHTGFCLETQHFPDSPNQPSFPSTVLRPGVTRHSTTTFSFTTVKGE